MGGWVGGWMGEWMVLSEKNKKIREKRWRTYGTRRAGGGDVVHQDAPVFASCHESLRVLRPVI